MSSRSRPPAQVVRRLPAQFTSFVGRVTALNEVTRSVGIESSAAYLANFLVEMFPDDGVENPASVEILRSGRPSGSMEAWSKSPGSSSPPPHRLSQSSALAPPPTSEDSVSITHHRDPEIEHVPTAKYSTFTVMAVAFTVTALLALAVYFAIRLVR